MAHILRDLFNVSPSPDIIEIWTKKAASCLYQDLGQVKLPTSRKVHIDETFLFHNRHKIFWAARDPEHNLILAWLFSHSRDTLAAYNFLLQLPAQGNAEGLTFVSDGLPAYRTIIPLL
ncbi:MAG: DDE-type integrase/transposase/recombinase, partial [Clostridia bacterium]|nr:DDE-type integrase/transposase/recombinase [Clostridia bacterium]